MKQTVFVIGAGAGVDIGMPTGEALSNQIAQKVNIRFEGGVKRIGGDAEMVDALMQQARIDDENVNNYYSAGRSIAAGIQYTRSIDSYIHTHRHDPLIKTCAKIAIAQTIIRSEKQSKIFVNETKYPPRYLDHDGFLKSWLLDFFRILQEGIIARETLGNFAQNVTIINFNYDRCVEHCLFRALQDLYQIDQAKAADIIKSMRIFHPYGKVAPLPWQDQGGLAYGGDPHGLDVHWPTFAKNIWTYNEEIEQGEELQRLRTALAEADVVVFLGFHFHRQNLELLSPAGEKKSRAVYGSAYDRSDADILVIKGQIIDLFHQVSDSTSRAYLLQTDCKGLFKEYGARLAS